MVGAGLSARLELVGRRFKRSVFGVPKDGARYELAVLAAIVLFGAALRFWQIGADPFWYDEAFTAMSVELSVWHLATTQYDVHPPLYYILLKPFAAFGTSEFALRSFSALAGTATIFVIWRIGRMLGGAQTGLFAAAWLATASDHILYSQEARSYTLLLLLFGLVLLQLLKADRPVAEPGGQPKGQTGLAFGLVYAGLALMALYTHVIAAIFLAAINIPIVLFLWGQQPTVFRNTALLRWGGLNLIVLALWSPFYLSGPSAYTEFDWLAQQSPTVALHFAASTLGVQYFPLSVNLLLSGLSGIGAFVLWRGGAKRASLILAAVAFAFPLFIWLIGLIKPVFMPRTILAACLGASLLLAVCVSAIRSKVLARAVMGLLLLMNLFSVTQYYRAAPEQDWHGAADYLAAQSKAGDGLLLCEADVQISMRGYLPALGSTYAFWSEHGVSLPTAWEAFVPYRVSDTDWRRAQTISDLETRFGSPGLSMRDLEAKHDTLWLIDSLCPGVFDKDIHPAMMEAGFTVGPPRDFRMIRIRRIQTRP